MLNYDNVKLWFAKDVNENIITISDITEDNKHDKYSCPMCGSDLIPKATKSIKVTSHFAHVDASKCSESMIHWWFKHKFLEKGDAFTVVSDKERQYIVKEVFTEQPYDVNGNTYRPDVTVLTECGNTIYFEMAFSNYKKVKDYIDIWLELKSIVVEVDIKMLMNQDEIPKFKALFYDGKCFNVKKNDTYYNTIGRYKEEKLQGIVSQELKSRIQRLDWFWNDVLRYKNDEVNIEYMIELIDSISYDDVEVIDNILSKRSCSRLYSELRKYDREMYFREFKNFINEICVKYNMLVNIVFDENDYYKKISILSKIRNENEFNEIGNSCGGSYNRIALKHDIKYINECIINEINDIKQINKQDRITKNKLLLESIEIFNKKYTDYEIKIISNSRYNCIIDEQYKVYLKIDYLYPDNTVIRIDITNEDVCHSSNLINIIEFIENEFNQYKNGLKPFKNKQDLINCFNSIIKKYKIEKMSRYYFKNEGEIIFHISKPYDVKSDILDVNIDINNIEFWNTEVHELVALEYNKNSLENILDNIVNDFLESNIKRCCDCKNNFNLKYNEIRFYQQKGFNIPKRCKSCRNKRRQNKL